VTPARIAIGTAHRDQAEAIRSLLPGPATGITVDTANKLQGREYDVTIVLHPLSGRLDATAFHLESGRLCVLTSRHRHACIVVARAGMRELLDSHPSTEPVHLNVPARFADGWEANQSILAHLHDRRVRARQTQAPQFAHGVRWAMDTGVAWRPELGREWSRSAARQPGGSRHESKLVA
jgi:AAA domain